MFLEESLWAEQPNVSIRHIESLSGNSPGPAKDIPDGPGDCANSLNARESAIPFISLEEVETMGVTKSASKGVKLKEAPVSKTTGVLH